MDLSAEKELPNPAATIAVPEALQSVIREFVAEHDGHWSTDQGNDFLYEVCQTPDYVDIPATVIKLALDAERHVWLDAAAEKKATQEKLRQADEIARREELQAIVKQRQRELMAATKELKDLRRECEKAKPEPGSMVKSFFGKKPDTKRYDFLCSALEQAEERYKEAEEAYNKARSARPVITGEINIVSLPKGITLEMAWIPPGEFFMGSPENEEGRADTESPRHKVTITRGFWMGRYPVTQEQWAAVMDVNASNGKLPVEQVSWNDCQEFIRRLNDQGEGTYRLPTEAQWEYACRAGTTTAWFFGKNPEQLDEYAWHDGNSDGKMHPAGEKQSNNWGLYDMYGNVWEWCRDWSGDYTAEAQTDPTGPETGECRVLRGGNWYSNKNNCRSATRSNNTPGSRIFGGGFRITWTQ